MGAIAFAMQFLSMLPSLISAGKEVVPLINQVRDSLSDMEATGRGPTDAEWAILTKARDEAHARVQR